MPHESRSQLVDGNACAKDARKVTLDFADACCPAHIVKEGCDNKCRNNLKSQLQRECSPLELHDAVVEVIPSSVNETDVCTQLRDYDSTLICGPRNDIIAVKQDLWKEADHNLRWNEPIIMQKASDVINLSSMEEGREDRQLRCWSIAGETGEPVKSCHRSMNVPPPRDLEPLILRHRTQTRHIKECTTAFGDEYKELCQSATHGGLQTNTQYLDGKKHRVWCVGGGESDFCSWHSSKSIVDHCASADDKQQCISGLLTNPGPVKIGSFRPALMGR